MESVELRHLDGVMGNFGVSDGEYIAISTTDARSTSLVDSKSTCSLYNAAMCNNTTCSL